MSIINCFIYHSSKDERNTVREYNFSNLSCTMMSTHNNKIDPERIEFNNKLNKWKNEGGNFVFFV